MRVRPSNGIRRDALAGIIRRTRPSELPAERPTGPEGHRLIPRGDAGDLSADRIATAAFAFRGYDVSNQGRSHELLGHRAYGPVFRAVLEEASAIGSEALGVKLDLVGRVRDREPSTLATYAQDAATIVAVEVAQLRLLEEFFGVPLARAGLGFGYSVGEVSALIGAGVYRMDQLLPVLLGFAEDSAALVAETTMGILFTRGPDLPFEEVERTCRMISGEGGGLIGPSAFLSPNAALLIGQGDTVGRFGRAMAGELSVEASLRCRPNRWPPLHTPLVWRRSIPNRAAVALHSVAGGTREPSLPLVSCVTGEASYTHWNSRQLLVEWTDHPQRLWDVIDHTLSSGIRLVVHVGPDPTLIPATFKRLGDNVIEHMRARRLERLGRTVIPGLGRHTWLTRMLPAGASVLRAPFVHHLILEDWLLERDVP
ncbi:ACP S-malonyltransferase [Tautonia plasticadhaerens]|uniref:Malonyl-CoA:ACP transacylase (MAT) domain-containing protein n=1 Tax=Tautonia plasticadhaerens TaxID=2527974 RepID=A0A518H3H3_9BACT|nr:ACP S-malonyltransferase [Tautonia plasticadhaerens]QDV35380.1 hypothetical protein ElP_32830 [Tautonia plasticadhaerens]